MEYVTEFVTLFLRSRRLITQIKLHSRLIRKCKAEAFQHLKAHMAKLRAVNYLRT